MVSPPLTPFGWLHVLLFGVLLPVMVLRNARRIKQRAVPLPSRLAHFQSTSFLLLACFGLSVATALAQRLPLFSAGIPHPWWGLAAGGAMYVAAVLIMRP